MHKYQQFTLPSNDGIHQSACYLWTPEAAPRGVVQIVHGVAEHVGRYNEVAEFLVNHGFVVCGEDHLGHGKTATDGIFGYFAPKNGWSLVLADVHNLRNYVENLFPTAPYFLLGHSMGSFLTRNYLIEHPNSLTGAILSGTGQEPAPLIAAGKLVASLECARLGDRGLSKIVHELSLGAYNKKFRSPRTSADWIARDESAVNDYLADELCQFKPTVSMFRDMMGGLQFIGNPHNVAKMGTETPIYFMSGDRDPVGGMGKGVEKVARLFRKLGCRDVTVRLYPDGRHEMFHEAERAEVFEDTLHWLDAHLPATK